MSFPRFLVIALFLVFAGTLLTTQVNWRPVVVTQTPYQPGPAQLAVLSSLKDYGYEGGRFTADDRLVVYLMPLPAWRMNMLITCQFAQRVGIYRMTVVAADATDRSNRLGSHTCRA